MIIDKKKSYTISFLVITYILCLIGLIFVYSSSSAFAFEKNKCANFYLNKQAVGILLGSIALLFARFISLKKIYKFSFIFFLFSLFLTALTIITPLGQTIHGSKRWLFFHGFGFQPSELLKVSLILYLAYFLNRKQFQLNSFVRGYLPFLTVLSVVSLILLKQPDFGQTITLGASSFLIFYLGGCKIKHLMVTLFSSVPLVIGLIFAQPYRLKRIMTFLDPWSDPKGAGFQIIQSLIAIGSGKLYGLGIAQSKQKFFYLPMQHTDFVFSIIAEETGFIGCFAIISLYLTYLYVGFKLSTFVESTFCKSVILGFIILINLQVLINLCVTTGLLPTKGIGLPFISYGKSAIICNLFMVGILLNCLKNEKELESLDTTLAYSGHSR
ncbi:putative lipid II flippase FtsW [Candidatus Dependentiae bacterium]|nr:putative lipid II flippase FtsW [Candidatus Dependentiae bacterium]